MTKYVSADNLEYYNEKIQQVIEDGDSLNASISVQLGEEHVGGYKTGDIISQGTSLESILKKMLAKQIPPIYASPYSTLENNSGTAHGTYEIGTSITPKLKLIFNQRDGGAVTNSTLTKNNVQVAESNSAPLIYEEETFILANSVTYKGSFSYKEGPVKNDNLGDPYPDTHITAGTVYSNTYSITPYRQGYFWGILNTSSGEAPLTSEIIRSGNKKNGAYSSGSISGIAAAGVSGRKRIFVACPATNKGVTKVIMPSAMNADCTADFVKQSDTILVEGANGYEAIPYNVWVYEPALISDDQTFTITLG